MNFVAFIRLPEPSPRCACPDGFGGGESDPTGQTPPDAARPLLGKRVLLVEDEAMLAFELQFALEDAGATVIGPALSLAEGMRFAKDIGSLDGAVLDVNLAGQTVMPLAQALAQARVPLLFNTGHADRRHLLESFPKAEVMFKPNRFEDVVVRLVGLIARLRAN